MKTESVQRTPPDGAYLPLWHAVEEECKRLNVSIRGLADLMPRGCTSEQLSRWINGAKTPNHWNQCDINEYFNAEIYP